MDPLQEVKPYYRRMLYRLFSAVFGFFLIGIGAYTLFFGVTDLFLRVVAGFLLALLGSNTLWSAIQARESWLSKIGPLP